MGNILCHFLLRTKQQLPIQGIKLMTAHLLDSRKILASSKLGSLQILWILENLPGLTREDFFSIVQQSQLAAKLVRFVPAVGHHDHITLIIL